MEINIEQQKEEAVQEILSTYQLIAEIYEGAMEEAISRSGGKNVDIEAE